jgi:hypothetical protein
MLLNEPACGRPLHDVHPRFHPASPIGARRAGRTGCRSPKLTEDDIEAAKAMLANPDIGATQIAHRLGVSPATLYRYIPAARTANTPSVADFSCGKRRAILRQGCSFESSTREGKL